YIYVSSTKEGENITKIDKNTENAEELDIVGFGLTVYKNYLYYLDPKNPNWMIYGLYRIDLNEPDAKPELVFDEVEPNATNYYYIASDSVWLYPAYFPTYRIDINDFSKKTQYHNDDEKYFIAGIDEKYRYILTLKIEDDRHIYTLARCLHEDAGFENREYLCAIDQPEWADLSFNNFLVINGGFAYYLFDFDIYKCELKAGAKSEIIYRGYKFGDGRFDMIAVTGDGIYIKKFHVAREQAYERIYDDCIYMIDHSGENEVALNYSPELLYFVSSEDGRLKYIKDGKIYPVL
ncbi:MAG: hypothetical protein FWH48_11165, partial [Oscillospiraceae bacterium]|nr:hypothetical protein [Oscillospiraceae bacterium]